MRNLKTIIFVSALALMASTGLAGCYKKPTVEYTSPPQKLSLESMRTLYIRTLQDQGIQVIHQGETFRIVLPDDYLFEPDSANIREDYKPTLQLVAKLIKTYDKINVKVAAYLDNGAGQSYLKALSTRQAQVVSDFLWYHGVDARLLYAVGYSHSNAVDWNGDMEGRSHNRRVEISFQYYSHIPLYD